MADTRQLEARVRRAYQLDAAGQLPEAIAAYEDVLRAAPALADCWYNLGVLQRRHGNFDAALAAYARALDCGIREPEQVHLNRAVIFSDHLQRPQQAEQELRAALRRNPDYAPALFNLANLHEDLGQRDAAAACYERVLQLEPDAAEPLARLAGLSRAAQRDDALIPRLRAARDRPAATWAERASVGFALGKRLDDCGDYDAAFAAYTRANRDSWAAAPSGVPPYDAQAEERLVDRLIQVFDGRGAVASSTARNDRPLFICGMFRSGSTLIEQVLAGHPCVRAGGELALLPQLLARQLQPFPDSVVGLDARRLDDLAAQYLDALARLFPAGERITDKRPDNYMLIGLIKRLFPRAKIIHTVRHPLDVCLSNFFLHLDHRMNYAFDLQHIAQHYRQYRRLMAHWRALHGEDILDVDYDRFVAAPRDLAARLLAFCGLEWDERCLDIAARQGAVKTASAWQVREPLYQRSSGRWKNYEPQLAPLRAALADLLAD
jgi:tetratricopeptide (TPR) repeat protein